MPNLRLSLTSAICAKASPEMQEYALHDTRQPGLSLRVHPGGTRVWILRQRRQAHLKHTLGYYPAMGVKEARKVAAALLSDGFAVPLARSSAPLFGQFQPEHEARHGSKLKPAGLRTYRSYVRQQLLPAFGARRIDEITRADVLRWFEAYSRTSPGAANRALGILGQMLNCAKAWGHLSADWTSPVSNIRLNRRKTVGTFLSIDQMHRLGTVLSKQIAEGCITAALLRFLCLTGCRVGEGIALEWRDVLPDRLCLRDSKTGAREVALGAAARQFLKTIQARRAKEGMLMPNGSVFPLDGSNRYERVRTKWQTIRAVADLPPTLRIHDLRHSFASHAIMSGESLLTTSRLLGHSRLETTARYAHLADDMLLTSAEKIGTLIMVQVIGE